MPGTHEGGVKAAATNKQRYGANFYDLIGRKGGSVKVPKGFSANPELASKAGKKGGKNSRRPLTEEHKEKLRQAAKKRSERKPVSVPVIEIKNDTAAQRFWKRIRGVK